VSLLCLLFKLAEISSRCLTITENVIKSNPETKPADAIVNDMPNGKPDKIAAEKPQIIVIIPNQ